MNKTCVAGLVLVALGGCASQEQLLDKAQPVALETAVSRARFEMNCPDATGQVLSREMAQPAVYGPAVGGVERAEYTVGVQGCGQRMTTVVVCAVDGTGCFAAKGR
ncbi:MAG TPA: hypothetical protein VEI05_03145 [Burkholderiaceae bacterium]|nr:hypothetical protein [Burkholderiaceae bacterium]